MSELGGLTVQQSPLFKFIYIYNLALPEKISEILKYYIYKQVLVVDTFNSSPQKAEEGGCHAATILTCQAILLVLNLWGF